MTTLTKEGLLSNDIKQQEVYLLMRYLVGLISIQMLQI